MYYKAGQVVLQSRAGITKRGNFYYKVGQLLQSSVVQNANKRNGRFWQPTPWFTPDFSGNRHFTLKSFWDVEVLLKLKERRNHTPSQGYQYDLWNSYLECFLYWQLVLKLLQNLKKITLITESDYSNVADATFLKPLSAVDMFLPILNFRNLEIIFLTNTLAKLTL